LGKNEMKLDKCRQDYFDKEEAVREGLKLIQTIWRPNAVRQMMSAAFLTNAVSLLGNTVTICKVIPKIKPIPSYKRVYMS
jgi:hypothetical protein